MAGYVFLPFPDKGPMVRREMRPFARHDRRVSGGYFGALRVVLEGRQALHVGSGFKTAVEGRVVRRTARAGDRPMIPGASFKGVIRSRFEAITRSCAFELPSERARIVSQSNPDVHRGHFTLGVKRMPVFDDGCGREERMCAACALFGFQSREDTRRSRVSVTDFIGDEGSRCDIVGMPAQYEPRLHHLGEFRVDRGGRDPEFEVSSLYGRKFYVDEGQFRSDGSGQGAPGGGGSGRGAPRGDGPPQWVEVAPRGTRFYGELHLFNVEATELGGLLWALGIDPTSDLKVGAGKAHGFGRVAVDLGGSTLFDERRRETELDRDRLREAFTASADYWDGGAKRLIEIYGGAGA